MLLQKNKKILIYIFFFILFGTLNNQKLLKIEFNKINQINIYGLNENEIISLSKKLDKFKNKNLFFLNKYEIQKYLDTINIIDDYTILKRYPSSLDIKIKKTNFLANVYKDGRIFFIGSNKKLIETNIQIKELPNIFGKFNKQSFFELLDAFKDSEFEISEIKNFYYFKSKRWDIETNSGILIKLPKDNLKNSLNLSLDIISNDKSGKIRILDLRLTNQVIINEE